MRANVLSATFLSFGLTFQAHARDIEIVNTATYTAKTEDAFAKACPDPKSEEPADLKACVDQTLSAAYDVAENLFEKYPGKLRGQMRECASSKDAADEMRFSGADMDFYISQKINAATICIEDFDKMVRSVGVNLEQDSRNIIADHINCLHLHSHSCPVRSYIRT